MIHFSNSLIEKYVEFYYHKDLDGLLLINNLINLIKKNDLKFEFKYKDKNIDYIIHETGIELIKGGKLKNLEILDFIKSDIYYNSNDFDKSFYRPLEILNKIDIETVDVKFFCTYNTIKFNNIFGKRMNDFYQRLCSLIKNMKDFEKIFIFFLFFY